MSWKRLMIVFALAAISAAAGEGTEGPVEPTYGETENGFHSWEERVLHQWMNRARVEPSVELEGCGTNCSTAELSPTCYTPLAPLFWEAGKGKAARFHSDSMARMNFFAHSTPCSLRTDLASVYPGSCDGGDCACSGAGSTSPSTRVGRFGGSYSGEIIAAGYSDPSAAFYGWLWEPVSSSTGCQYSSGGVNNTNGHRWLILKSGPAVGAGFAAGGAWGRYYSADFGGTSGSSPIPSGTHYPRQATSVAVWANWYHTSPPTSARVIVDGIAQNMTLARGTGTNGAWTATVSGVGTGCHRYYFEFRGSDGVPVTHPTNGSLGIGPAGSCPDWSASRSGAAGSADDFTGDGNSDLIWRQPSTGRNVWWAMDGAVRTGYGSLLDVPGTEWTIGGTGDFNGDGSADLVWRNAVTGQNVLWLMDGTDRSSHVVLPSVEAGWEIGAVGDLDGDGDADIVWRRASTGANVLWTMNGTARQSYATLLSVPGSEWAIVGSGDLDGNGRSDLVWRNYTTGQNVVWFMNGATRQSYASTLTVVGAAWRIVGVADFDGDGRADLVWRNVVTGQNVLWFMEGATRSSYASLAAVGDLSWAMAGPR